MDYVLTCEGATSAPVISGTVVDACTTAAGAVAWVEPASAIPELTLAGAGTIAAAILLLWASAWAFRVLRKMIEES